MKCKKNMLTNWEFVALFSEKNNLQSFELRKHEMYSSNGKGYNNTQHRLQTRFTWIGMLCCSQLPTTYKKLVLKEYSCMQFYAQFCPSPHQPKHMDIQGV